MRDVGQYGENDLRWEVEYFDHFDFHPIAPELACLESDKGLCLAGRALVGGHSFGGPGCPEIMECRWSIAPNTAHSIPKFLK